MDEGLKLPLNTTIQVWKGSEDVARIAGLGHRVIVRCVQQALRMHACIPCARAQEHCTGVEITHACPCAQVSNAEAWYLDCGHGSWVACLNPKPPHSPCHPARATLSLPLLSLFALALCVRLRVRPSVIPMIVRLCVSPVHVSVPCGVRMRAPFGVWVQVDGGRSWCDPYKSWELMWSFDPLEVRISRRMRAVGKAERKHVCVRANSVGMK